jgi:hypothetical protein
MKSYKKITKDGGIIWINNVSAYSRSTVTNASAYSRKSMSSMDCRRVRTGLLLLQPLFLLLVHLLLLPLPLHRLPLEQEPLVAAVGMTS